MSDHLSVVGEHGTAKAGVAWAGYALTKGLDMVGIHAWSDFAGAVAGLYTVLLICDWCMKKWKGRK